MASRGLLFKAPTRSLAPKAKGKLWTDEQWADIVRCARVARGERSGLSVRGAMRVLREYASAVESMP